MGDEDTIREIISEVDTDNVSLYVFFTWICFSIKMVQSVNLKSEMLGEDWTSLILTSQIQNTNLKYETSNLSSISSDC